MNASPVLAVMPEEPETFGLSRRPPVKARMGMDFQTLERLYQRPLFELIAQSREVHLQHWRNGSVECCGMLGRKPGECHEDEGQGDGMRSVPEIVRAAEAAKARGASRFCLGAGWGDVRDGTKEFEELLLVGHEVSGLGLEACVTLEKAGPVEIAKLKKAGVEVYHHPAESARERGLAACSDETLGVGASVTERLREIEALCQMTSPPESVSIQCLTEMPGVPSAEQAPANIFDLVRLVAVARLALPKARLRLAAGRRSLSREGQALCLFVGANSLFIGNRCRTPAEPAADDDLALLRELGLSVEEPTAKRPPVPGPALAPMAPKPRKRYVEPPPGSLTEILTRLAVSTQLAPGASG